MTMHRTTARIGRGGGARGAARLAVSKGAPPLAETADTGPGSRSGGRVTLPM